MTRDYAAAEPEPEDLLLEASARHSRIPVYIRVLEAFEEKGFDYDELTDSQLRELPAVVGQRWQEIASALSILRRAGLI